MISPARRANSQSLLRELEFALILIQDDKTRAYFLNKLNAIYQKKNDPSVTKTGIVALKTELLSYLRNQGFLNTANIWTRNLSIDRNAINELLANLQKELLKSKCEGILEIHLQDREINSPHIQYVGTNAIKAEMIIAGVLVVLGYENSVRDAIGKNIDFQPYFELNQKARIAKIEEKIEYEEQKDELKEIESLFKLFDNRLDTLKSKTKTQQELSKNNILNKLNSTKLVLKSRSTRLRQRLRLLKRRRKFK